jgi:hypothetical protein
MPNISDEDFQRKKIAGANYNKLLITINQDLLGKFIFDAKFGPMPMSERRPGIYKVKDITFKPSDSELKIQRLFDQNGV